MYEPACNYCIEVIARISGNGLATVVLTCSIFPIASVKMFYNILQVVSNSSGLFKGHQENFLVEKGTVISFRLLVLHTNSEKFCKCCFSLMMQKESLEL